MAFMVTTTWSDASESLRRIGAVVLGRQPGELPYWSSGPDRTTWYAPGLSVVITDVTACETAATKLAKLPRGSTLAFGALRDRACHALASSHGARTGRRSYRRRAVTATEVSNARSPVSGTG